MPGPAHADFQRIHSPFEGSLVRLRAIEEQDLPRINAGIWNPEVSRYLSMAWPEPLALTREWWEGRRASPDPAFSIETLAGELVGVVSIEDVDARTRSGGLGIWVAEPYWNQGYGTDAVRTACRFAFREMNLQRVYLHVHEDNERGRRAYEHVGFTEEGRYPRAVFSGGRHLDLIEMGLLEENLVEG